MKLRFIALHMMYGQDGARGADQRTGHDQQVVLLSMKPVAAAAQPE